MSQMLLDYMRESPLFHKKHLQETYRRLTDADLQRELDGYRRVSLERANQLEPREQNLSVLVEGIDALQPDEMFLKQSALYIDEMIIADPLFEHTVPKKDVDATMNAFLGMQPQGINRVALIRAASYMTSLRSAIRSGFIQFAPLSYLHEPPKEITTELSENFFADIAPEEIMEMFWRTAKVSRLRKVDRGWQIVPDEPLHPCRAINVAFDALPDRHAIYYLFKTKLLSLEESTGRFVIAQELPDEPPDEEQFNAWIFQSTNQAARRILNSVSRETYLAHQLGATYLTTTQFIADLLKAQLKPARNLQVDTLNLSLDLDLPVLSQVTLDDVIRLREQDGEAFYSFRVDLAKRLRELRQVEDPDELTIKIQNVAHELTEVQVNEINKKMSGIRKKALVNAGLFVGGLIATIQTNGFGLPTLLFAMERGYKNYMDYMSDVRANPAFLLWKLNRMGDSGLSSRKRNRRLARRHR